MEFQSELSSTWADFEDFNLPSPLNMDNLGPSQTNSSFEFGNKLEEEISLNSELNDLNYSDTVIQETENTNAFIQQNNNHFQNRESIPIMAVQNIEVNIQENNTRKKRIFVNTSLMGRKTKGNSIQYIPGQKLNNKYRDDNVRLKYKRCFFFYLFQFLNKKSSENPQLNKNFEFQKLSGEIMKKTKKQDILKMLETTAKDFLSQPISEKCKNFSPNHNKILIKYIYEDIKDLNITRILDLKIEKLMDIFCDDQIKNDEFKYFKRLNYYIKKVLIEKEHEDEIYINLFKEKAKNFKSDTIEIIGRDENEE